MSNTDFLVSVIIPTHNRSKSIQRLLQELGKQTYPQHLMEVIVVADGCMDDTLTMLQNFKSPYALRYVTETGKGAAVARNRGAQNAAGTLLLFIDDDVAPSVNLVAAHVQAHNKPNKVVIGYLPLPYSKNKKYYYIKLWSWWEEKYQQMRSKAYRYSYQDMLSGNFSIAKDLFAQLGGFNELFRCREDYELGIRLIKNDTEFEFCTEAWGYHCDEVTDVNRSLKRKMQEGIGDVQCATFHPDLTHYLQLSKIKFPLSRKNQFFLFLVFHAGGISDSVANGLRAFLSFLLQWQLYGSWDKLLVRLYNYWYFRGVALEVKSKNNFKLLLQKGKQKQSKTEEALALDIQLGLSRAEAILDEVRPRKVHLFYGAQSIGHIPDNPGAERLSGAHLRAIISKNFSWPLTHALAIEKPVQPMQAVEVV